MYCSGLFLSQGCAASSASLSRSLIEFDFSNYSAWHLRSLLPELQQQAAEEFAWLWQVREATSDLIYAPAERGPDTGAELATCRLQEAPKVWCVASVLSLYFFRAYIRSQQIKVCGSTTRGF